MAAPLLAAAVAFNVAALATAAMLVTFSDLAFGWSTTLGARRPPELVADRIQSDVEDWGG
jgi:hypothetical protein